MTFHPDSVTIPLDKTIPDDFLPAASLETLRLRAELLAKVRQFFAARGYWEVETPLLSHDVLVDAWLEPFVTHFHADGHDAGYESVSAGEELFLQTSPEFGMKRLLAAGATAIYQITRAMRNAEFGRHHNPEFTMIEWYRVGDTHHDQMNVVEDLVRHVFGWCGGPGGVSPRVHQPAVPDVAVPFERLRYDQAFQRYAGTTVLELSAAQLAKLACRRGIQPPPTLRADDRDGWLNLLLAELVEPHLGRDRGQFLYDYPASQAALSCIRDDEPPVAERFELYIKGIELCNGYHELTDAEELRRRMASQAEIRRREGRRELPRQNRLLEAMQCGLPACAGVALGFDRLVMQAIGADSLSDVMPFPFDRA